MAELLYILWKVKPFYDRINIQIVDFLNEISYFLADLIKYVQLLSTKMKS